MIKEKIKVKYPIKTGYKFIDEKGQHRHELNGKPLVGTTTATKEVLKPPLAWYGAGKAVELFGVKDAKVINKIKNKEATEEEVKTLTKGLTNALGALKELDLENYQALVDKAYRNHAEYSDIRKEEGNELHDTLEKYVNYCLRKGGTPHMETFKDERVNTWVKWAVENIEEFLYAECYCYSEKLWLGGKFDLIFKGRDGKTYLGDYKSAKVSYHENWVQMALYDTQIMENGVLDKEGNIIGETPVIDGYALFPFGGKILPDYRYNMKDYWKAGEGVVDNYRLINLNS